MTPQPLTAGDIILGSQKERDELVELVNAQLLDSRATVEEGGSACVVFDRPITNRLQKALEDLYFDWNIAWECSRARSYWSLK